MSKEKIPWYQRDDRGDLTSALSHQNIPTTIEDLVHESGNQHLNYKLAELCDIKEYIDALAQLWIELESTDVRTMMQLKDRLTYAMHALNASLGSLYNSYGYWQEDQIDENQTYFEQLKQFRHINQIKDEN